MTMMISTDTVDDVVVVALAGDLDSSAAAGARDRLHPLIEPGGRVLIDLSDVPYMSSAGLRTMLLVYRQAESVGCRIGLAGVSPDLPHMMTAVGFLDFFALSDTVAAGVHFLGAPVRDTA